MPQWGPAGGGIWAAPTVDPKRDMVYVATGNNYAEPSQKTSDAVIALDMNSGTVKWVNQTTPNDNWTHRLPRGKPRQPELPRQARPRPRLLRVPVAGHRERPRPAGAAAEVGHGVRARSRREGEVVWSYRIGQGSGLGGQWGGAADEQNAYFGVSDILTPKPGGIRAVDLATGRSWPGASSRSRRCAPQSRTCRASQGAAVTVIPGAVLSGSLDGGMRAYSAADGKILWTFDTNREFTTVNGVKAKGGGMEGPGAIVAGGMIYFNSGYGGFVGNPGNVLLAFGVD